MNAPWELRELARLDGANGVFLGPSTPGDILAVSAKFVNTAADIGKSYLHAKACLLYK